MGSSFFSVVNSQAENLPRRERMNLQQREEILQAALKLFSEKGYNNASMHEIAKEAEFGIGTLYKYFTNKEELYKSLIKGVAEKWHHAVVQVLEQEQDPVRAIKKHIAVRRELFLENLPVVRLYYAETRGVSFNIKAGLDHDLVRYCDELIEKLASVFEKGIKEDVFRPLDPHDIALALDGIINAFLFRMMRDPARFRKRDNLSTVMDIFLKGVLRK